MVCAALARAVHDGGGAAELPGPLARGEGDPPVADADVNAAYDYAGDTDAYYWHAFGRASLEDARKGLETLTHERDKSVLTDLVEREKTISSTEGEVTKARKRAEYERLVSPVNGTVHGLATYTIGGIVKPAQDVVSIVPDGTPLVVEAMVQNKDIGFVKIGQETEVKLDTFPFQKYGTIRGKVIHLSPDAVEDEKLGPVYRMRTSIERPVMRVDGRDVPVTPGMSASVEVKTGDRRIIEFFLSPIIKYARESLTLR